MNDKYKKQIINFFHENRRMPTYSEICKTLNFKAKSSAYELITKYVHSGFLKKDSSGKLLPGSNFWPVKVLGTVEAGFPSPAEEELADTMSLDEFLIDNKEASYILRVSGNSMKDAGIIDGDMVIVDRSATPKDGNIVIAEVDGNWTMKYFKKKGKQIFLRAANKKYDDIYPESELKVAAVVKSVIRKY